MFCPNCGTNLEESAAYCPLCGTTIAAKASQPSQEQQGGFPDPTVIPTPEQGRIDPRNLAPEMTPEPWRQDQNIDIDSLVSDLNEPEPEPESSGQGFTDEDMAWFTDHQTTSEKPRAPQQTSYPQPTPYPQPTSYPQPTQYSQQQTDAPQSPFPQPMPGFVPPVPVDLTPRKSNVLLGVIGAVVFSLIGCVIWVLIGKLGYISYLGALAMSLLTVTGYKLLGRKFDIAGVITCLVVVAAAVFVSNVFIESMEMKEALDILKDEIVEMADSEEYTDVTEEQIDFVLDLMGLSYDSFSDIFFHFFDYADSLDVYMKEYSDETVMGTFTYNLVLGYVFSAIAFAVVAIPQYKASQKV